MDEEHPEGVPTLEVSRPTTERKSVEINVVGRISDRSLWEVHEQTSSGNTPIRDLVSTLSGFPFVFSKKIHCTQSLLNYAFEVPSVPSLILRPVGILIKLS